MHERFPMQATSVALTVCFLAWSAAFALAAENTIKIVRNDTTVSIAVGDRPLMQYRHGDVPFKPYVVELYSPAGVQILRDSPHDHKHHHALMFAVTVDDVDFWGETPGRGSQKHDQWGEAKSEQRNGVSLASFAQLLEWLKPGSEAPLLVERRSIQVAPVTGAAPATLLTWRSQLQVPSGKPSAVLTGHHYFGLGMRFVMSMDTGGKFFNSANQPGEVVRGSERLVSAQWCAYQAAADGKPVTVALFDHPHNPRHPARMFTMGPPFAYLSATMNLWKEPLRVEADKPLDLCYGVALWDGQIEAAEVEKSYQRWLAAMGCQAAKQD